MSVFYDAAAIPDADDFSPIPDGNYPCTLIVVNEDTTRNGDKMWNLTWQIDGGEFNNRYIWDRLVFSEKGWKRAKLVFSRLGIPKDYRAEITPEKIQGKRALITIETEQYEWKGKSGTRNKVTFDGVEGLNSPPPTPDPDDDIPF